MKNNSWIKLFRSLLDSWLWDDKPFARGQAWVDLLLLAQSQDGDFLDHKGNVIHGERGVVYRSVNWLAERWGWSRNKVNAFLNRLANDGAIILTQERARAKTTISIVNYDAYQNSRTSAGTSKEQVEDKSRTSRGHKQELHNDRKTDISPISPFNEIKDLYNSICKSYSKVTVLSDRRKNALRARLNSGYTVEDFKKLFEKAEASDFLKGRNDRDWRATLDWLIKDANMAKVLDGNYDNSEGREDGKQDKDGGSSEDYYRRFCE